MQTIRTRYHAPTNFKGARISAKCEARTIFISFPYELDHEGRHKLAAEALIRAMGWHKPHGRYADMIGGEFAGDMYWTFADGVRTEVRA
jgi:hypothetical protein